MPTDLREKRVVVTGGNGFLGTVLCRSLRERGCEQVLIADLPDFDLVSEDGVRSMYAELKPQIVLHLAAQVGGIGANMDNRSIPGVYIAVVMGRHAGFLTAASALGRKYPDDGPHLIYLPEREFSVDGFIDDVRAVHQDPHAPALELGGDPLDRQHQAGLAGDVVDQREPGARSDAREDRLHRLLGRGHR